MKFNFKFNAEGLIPAIIQQAPTAERPYGRVLMMAWMNQESIETSLKKGVMHYWSRSRKRLWLKGETSGHVQKIVRWFHDCDRDTLLFYVDQAGGACHTGFESCFFSEMDLNGQQLPIQEKALFDANQVYAH
jgi:phosphoribosyl-AMP cyclohydrolase